MVEPWYRDSDTEVVHQFAWDVHDGGGSPYLSAGAAAKVLDTLTPTIERIRREAKAESLRTAAQMARSNWSGTVNLALPWDPETAASFDVWLEHLADMIEDK